MENAILATGMYRKLSIVARALNALLIGELRARWGPCRPTMRTHMIQSKNKLAHYPIFLWLEITFQFHSKFFRKVYNQFRMKKFLKKIIIIPVIGIKILPGDNLYDTAEPVL